MNKRKALNGVTKEFIHKRANGIEENNIQQVMDRASDIKNKVIHSEKKMVASSSAVNKLPRSPNNSAGCQAGMIDLFRNWSSHSYPHIFAPNLLDTQGFVYYNQKKFLSIYRSISMDIS